MAEKYLLTISDLRQLLRYDPVTGKLFWLDRGVATKGARIFNKRFAGKEAFTYRDGEKHLTGRIYGHLYLAHRVIWALVYGAWPTLQIDHINGNPVDNRLANLREVEGAENQRNMKRPKTNTSGVCGVSWNASRGKWRARISAGGRDITLGRFDDFGDAVEARNKALVGYGFHPNHGRD